MTDKREITPELLARLTVVLFKEISIRAVLEERIPYNRLSAKDVARLMLKDEYFANAQSMDSCKSLANSVIDYVTQKTAWQNCQQEKKPKYLNVFDLLMLTLQDLLVMNHTLMESRYDDILSWRLMVQHLGEELLLSARYAQWDYEHCSDRRNRYDEFAWPYVTNHNNQQLNAIMHRGVSEHHCHLFASTPYFHVSWVNLMNVLLDSKYQENLQSLNPDPWSAETEHRRRGDDVGAEKNYYGELIQTRAAWIRLYLCERLAEKTTPDQRYYDLINVRRYDNWRKLLMSRKRLQAELNSYSNPTDRTEDYALSFAKLKKSVYPEDYHTLISERWLYYRIFWDYCKPNTQRQLTFDDYNLFFVYCLLRLRIRDKLVQNNRYIGFSNFQQIQRRKDYFLGDKKSVRVLTRLAVNETLQKKHMKEIEVRISPNGNMVRCLEKAINSPPQIDSVNTFLARRVRPNSKEAKINAPDLRERYYYVFHFLKRQDPSQEPDATSERCQKTGRICRHDQQRRFYMLQAKDIIRFREQQPLLAKRVLGIDAASKELGCRPEVFGTIFRLLGEHQVQYGGYKEPYQHLPFLGKTYHVGEDFSDIVDGLRAIDEAINFLELDSGDRLGHALALGVNVEEWYDQKHREISLSVQDYMDNLAWLYHALTHFSVPNVGPLKERINRDFEYWFRIVYRNSIHDDQIKRLMQNARKNCYDRSGEDHGRYHEHTCHFDIMDYYRAWTLRGDDPSCYIDGYFKRPFSQFHKSPEEKAKVCTNFPSHYEDRYISEYSLLNYLYQFNDHVRREGRRRIKVDISAEYIQAVKIVQVEMRYRIARRGIAIETTPTSNVMIGTFRKYEKHPLLAFYNRGLPVTEEEEQDCAQLHVSINTDNPGVFCTNLETEYALIARSTEQIMNEQGKPRFKKSDVYTWLDNIRIMGNEQSFQSEHY